MLAYIDSTVLKTIDGDLLVSCFLAFYNLDVLFVHREKQRAQKIFKASPPMDLAAARTKVMGFGMQLLDGIDPNPDNFVCAGIIHARSAQIGCLLRLEPNKQAQVRIIT